MVAMEETPGCRRLPFAHDEVKAVLKMLDSQSYSHVYNPPRSDLLQGMRDCTVFHFAGHGMVNAQDPSLSGLLLSDESGSQVTLLRVKDLQSLRFQEWRQPLLAYLSACSTGRIEDGKLVDEGIHLMGACRLAGFRHVIGSLWEVSDRLCVTISHFIYETMLASGLEDASVAISVHHAVRRLRTMLQEEDAWRGRNAVKVPSSAHSHKPGPPFWAAFIHMGL